MVRKPRFWGSQPSAESFSFSGFSGSTKPAKVRLLAGNLGTARQLEPEAPVILRRGGCPIPSSGVKISLETACKGSYGYEELDSEKWLNRHESPCPPFLHGP